jgi:hypothetical protein
MFGGSLFGGEDENAAALGGEDGETSSSMGDYGKQGFGAMENGSYEGSQSGWTNAGDPAEQAIKDSSANLSHDVTGQDVSAGIGKAAGLFSSIYGMFDARAKRNRRNQRRFSRQQAAYHLAQAQRNVAQYAQDSAIQEQKLSQSYAGRGLGESSIYNEGMQYFRDTRDRTMQGLAEAAALANTSQDLVRSNISMSYANVWLSFGNSLANMV